MKRNILVMLFFLLFQQVHAQSPEIQAKAAFMKAQEYFGNGEYEQAIDRLEKVKELLGTSNPRVAFLMTQACIGAGQATKAEQSISEYFDQASDADPNYTAMLAAIEEVNELKEVEVLRKQERAEWNKVLDTNTKEAYRSHLTSYPNGQFVDQANAKLREFPLDPFTDPRDGQVYETVRMGNQIWMSENMRYDLQGAMSPRTKDVGFGNYYSLEGASRACPPGWRLPTRTDVNQLFESQGEIVSGGKSKTYLNYISETYAIINRTAFLSTTSWKNNAGTNDNGFNVLATGIALTGGMGSSRTGIGKQAEFWMDGGKWTFMGGYLLINTLIEGTFKQGVFKLSYQCRCVKDE